MWIADPICECVIVVAQLGQRTLAKVLSRCHAFSVTRLLPEFSYSALLIQFNLQWSVGKLN